MSGTSKKGKRPSPWSIRGVPAEARNAAMDAAKREGMSLGEWLDRAIRHQVKATRKDEVAPTLEETLAKLVTTMEAQNARLEAVEARRGLFGFFRGIR